MYSKINYFDISIKYLNDKWKDTWNVEIDSRKGEFYFLITFKNPRSQSHNIGRVYLETLSWQPVTACLDRLHL